jgi:hypothetical protein
MYGHFLNTIIMFYITKVMGCRFYEMGEEVKLRCLYRFLFYFDILWTTKERSDGNTKATMNL